MSTAATLISQISQQSSPTERLAHIEKIVKALLEESGAFGSTTESFIQPEIESTAIATVNTTSWMTPTQGIIISRRTSAGVIGGGYVVERIVDPTHVLLKRIAFAGSSTAGTTIPAKCRVTVGGVVGVATGTGGTGGSGGTGTDETSLSSKIGELEASISIIAEAISTVNSNSATAKAEIRTELLARVGSEITSRLTEINRTIASLQNGTLAEQLVSLNSQVGDLEASLVRLSKTFAFVTYSVELSSANIDTEADTISMSSHELEDGDLVFFELSGDNVVDTLPEPLVEGDRYYWRYTSLDTGFLSLTVAGDAIDLETAGAGRFFIRKADYRQAGAELIDALNTSVGLLRANFSDVRRVIINGLNGKEFPYSAVSLTQIAIANHGYAAGEFVQLSSTGILPSWQFPHTGAPVLITSDDIFMVGSVLTNSFKLMRQDGGGIWRDIVFTNAGTGTHTMFLAGLGTSMATRFQTLESSLNSSLAELDAKITTEQTTRTGVVNGLLTTISTIEQQIIALTARPDGAVMTARVTTLETATANLESANASILEQIDASRKLPDGETISAAVETLRSAFVSEDGVVAKYMLKIGAGNTITGIEAVSSENEGGLISSFKILASLFQIVAAEGDEATPMFSVDEDEVIVNPPLRSANFAEGLSGWRLGSDGILDAVGARVLDGSMGYSLPPPQVNPAAGNFDDTINVFAPSPPTGADLRYTLDGAPVERVSAQWPSNGGVNLAIVKTSILRAAVFETASARRSPDAFGIFIKNAPLVGQVSEPYLSGASGNTGTPYKYSIAFAVATAGAQMESRFSLNAEPVTAWNWTGTGYVQYLDQVGAGWGSSGSAFDPNKPHYYWEIRGFKDDRHGQYFAPGEVLQQSTTLRFRIQLWYRTKPEQTVLNLFPGW